jgi:hypothetical protein
VIQVAEPLTREGLAWARDGRHLFFVKSTGQNRGELFRVSAGGGAPEPCGIAERGLSLLSVHPGGARIAYTVGQYFQTNVWAFENFVTPSR